MKKLLVILLCWWVAQGGRAQYPPPAGQPGSTAIHADSSIFIGWATTCEVIRGYVNISDTSIIASGSNRASYGLPEYALGKADNQVVSLGDGGIALVSFYPLEIFDGPGFDFAVFENGFSDSFLELAFVEVSADGEHYYRFPAHSLTPTLQQVGPFDTLDARLLNNLAGKYRAFYGTPFDLAELTAMPENEKQHVRFVRIIDVVGSINPSYGSIDAYGNLINDPFPTSFASGGFDLDAVGIIHAKTFIPEQIENFTLYPNPSYDFIYLSLKVQKVEIFDSSGRIVLTQIPDSSKIDVSSLQTGTYILRINNTWSFLLVKQ